MSSVSDPSPARLGVSRRTLTRGAAWTAPLVAVNVAAPAYAVSCLAPYRLNWGTTPYNKSTSAGTQTGIAQVAATSGPGTPLNVTFTSTVAGTFLGTPTRHIENLTVSDVTNVGGLGAAERGLSLRHESGHGTGVDNRQTVTISFARPVTRLSFTIADLDSQSSIINSNFWDQVELSGARTFPPNPNVTGQGIANSPWHHVDGNTSVDDGSGGGNITVTYAGTVSSLTLLFYSSTATAAHRVFLTDFTFTAACT